VGALAADVVHDAANALFGLVGLLGLLEPGEPLGADRLELLRRSAGDLDTAFRPLLRFARADGEGRAGDLAGAVREALLLFRHGERKHVVVEAAVAPGDLAVACEAALLTQAVVHGLLAADPEGLVEVEAGRGHLRVAPVRTASVHTVAAGRIAARAGGSLELAGGSLRLALPPR
jgi:hypothetical protein